MISTKTKISDDRIKNDLPLIFDMYLRYLLILISLSFFQYLCILIGEGDEQSVKQIQLVYAGVVPWFTSHY